MVDTPLEYMQRALALAAQGRLAVSPNPMVGCVLVKQDAVIAEGWHQQYGGPHAEVIALKAAGEQAAGATLYINLEPCCHQGKTPPCTNALIAAGIKKVYIACLDPNPLVAGKGVAALQQAGIDVVVGLCEAEASALNKIFFHYMIHKRPFVIAKWAMSLDGKTITHPADDRQISSENSLIHTHHTRLAVDAILVGGQTIAQDDPALTARLTPFVKQPLRVIVTSRGGVPLNARIFNRHLPGKTLIATTAAVNKTWYHTVCQHGIEVLILPANAEGKVDLPSLLTALATRGISSVLVEGGMTIHQAFFKAELVDEVQVYIAPVVIADLNQKLRLSNVTHTTLDPDLLMMASVRKEYV